MWRLLQDMSPRVNGLSVNLLTHTDVMLGGALVCKAGLMCTLRDMPEGPAGCTAV